MTVLCLYTKGGGLKINAFPFDALLLLIDLKVLFYCYLKSWKKHIFKNQSWTTRTHLTHSTLQISSSRSALLRVVLMCSTVFHEKQPLKSFYSSWSFLHQTPKEKFWKLFILFGLIEKVYLKKRCTPLGRYVFSSADSREWLLTAEFIYLVTFTNASPYPSIHSGGQVGYWFQPEESVTSTFISSLQVRQVHASLIQEKNLILWAILEDSVG